jgi:hypothetical protein
MGSFIKIALLCFTATGLPTIHCRPNSGDGTYLPTHTHPANTGWIKTSGIIVGQDPLKKDAGKKKKSLHTCDSLCKNKKLIDSSMQIEGFYSKSFNRKNNQSTIYKCHSYLAALANREILDAVGLPLPPDPLVPQMFTINHTKLLGSKTKDLTQDGWRSIQNSDEFNTLFSTFVKQYRLQLCKAATLGVGDLMPHNIFYKKDNHGNIEFVVADYDTRTTKPTIPSYFADLSIKAKENLISFVTSENYISLLNQVFKILGYPKSEKQTYKKGIAECIDVLEKIKDIKDKESLRNTDINTLIPKIDIMIGNPIGFESNTGRWWVGNGYSQSDSKSVICKCG